MESHTVDLGGGLIYNQSKSKLLDGLGLVANCQIGSFMVVYQKAVRRVGRQLGIPIGHNEVIALSMVKACGIHIKESNLSRIITWSGYTRGWQGLMKSSIRSCLDRGLLDRVEARNGFRLILNSKGEAVLTLLDSISQIVIDEILGKREKPKRQKL